MTNPCQLGCVGQWERAEFRPLSSWLNAHVPAGSRFPTVATMSAAEQLWPAPPDVLVVGQSWPDEITVEDVLAWQRWAPLSRVVCAYGAWCAADGRTRTIWPLALRVPVWLAADRIQREWTSVSRGERPLGPVWPWTASREEIAVWDYAPIRTTDLHGLRVSVLTADRPYARLLADELATCGGIVVPHATTLAESPAGCDVLLADLEPWTPPVQQSLADARRRLAPRVMVGLADFPIRTAIADWTARGVRCVVPKLLPLDRLAAVLQEAVGGGPVVASPTD